MRTYNVPYTCAVTVSGYVQLTMVSWFDLYVEIFKFVLFLLFTPQFPSFAFFGREKHRHERSAKGMFLSICTIRIE